MRKHDRRLMWFCLITIASATASTYIAVDYSRMFSLATIAVVTCLISARRHLKPPIYKGIIVLNILIPSFYVGGNSGLVTFKGLYYQAFRHLLPLPRTEQTNNSSQ